MQTLLRNQTHPMATDLKGEIRPLWRGRVLVASLATALAVFFAAAPASAQTAADSSVTVVWTATGDDGITGTATTYDLRYRTANITGTDTLTWWSGATSVSGMPAPRAAGSTDSMRVRGLSPLTTYYFALRVADEAANWSGFSNLATKTTSGDATPPSAIADLAVTGVTGTSIAIRWTAPGDDANTGTAASYDIRYSTTAITTSNWSTATSVTGEPTPTAAGTQQTFTITNLTGSRTYFVAMKTTDDAANVSGLSNVVSGTTADVIAPAPVRDLSYDADSNPIDPIAFEDATVDVAIDAH